MIQKISAINSKTPVIKQLKTQKRAINEPNTTTNPQSGLSGIPKSYISFRGAENEIKLSEDGQDLYNKAAEIALDAGHTELTPHHVIKAAVNETTQNLIGIPAEVLDTGVVESISPLSKIANDYAKENLLTTAGGRAVLADTLDLLEQDIQPYLDALPVDNELLEGRKEAPKIPYSADFNTALADIAKETPELNAHMILATALNTLSKDNVSYPQMFLNSMKSLSNFKKGSELEKNYMKFYDSKAINIWNKLALGSNMFVTYNDRNEADRITSSFVNTINAPKHGGFSNQNTSVYVMADDITPQDLLNEVNSLVEEEPEKNNIFIVKMDNYIFNALNENNEQHYSAALAPLLSNEKENLKLIFLQNENSYFEIMQDPVSKTLFSKFITYALPPMRTYEAQQFLSENKEYLQKVKTPFTEDAKNQAILYADKLEGIFPDKAVDLMKRISSYYGGEKKKITLKEVNEFASVANDLFTNGKNASNIIYDTGKNLNSLYGKETTKKDIEAIVRQIKSGNIGTKGIILYSKDEEAGSGRKFTAEVIAGEAKVPFLEFDTSDFATAAYENENRIPPQVAMSKIFADAKKAAAQNEHKTAIIYVNNFEEFAFSGPYLPGYKQAMSQLAKEMAAAEAENLNILVLGSTNEYFVDALPVFVKGFDQRLVVDTPAYNKQSRKEVLTHRIAERKLPLAYRTLADKDYLIDKLVKLTEYMSFVEIKSLIEKTEQIMLERGKKKASIGEFIEAYLQLATGRTSLPQMPEYNKQATTSHECGHATNLEVMNDLYRAKGKPWHHSRDVNFITLDPRGNFLGAVFQNKTENIDYPIEALFIELVCAYGGYSCEKLFFDTSGSAGIMQDLAQATQRAKSGVELCGFGVNTGKISNAAKIMSAKYSENVFKDMEIILTNAQLASDLITETYRGFNQWFTQKYTKLIGTNNCLIDGDDFRKALHKWKDSQPASWKEECAIMEDMVLDIINSTKKGKIYGKLKEITKSDKLISGTLKSML